MKTNAFLFLIIIVLMACGNTDKSKAITVPSTVKDAFSKQFPSASNVKWSMEGENEYEAEYKIGEVEQSSNYDASGKWLVTETEISKMELPDTVQSLLSNEFSEYSVKEVEKVKALDMALYYEVELEKDEMTVILEISADGTIIKKEESNEEDEESEEEDDEDGEEDEEGKEED